MSYFVKIPWWVQKARSQHIWKIDTFEKELFLTFDDGPHPEATPMILDILKEFKAKATFFCLGNNVKSHPDIVQRIRQDGHGLGSHSFHHENGWKTKNETYLESFQKAHDLIQGNLFRPPYGKIKAKQTKAIHAIGIKTIMWSVMPGDWEASRTPASIFQRTIKNAEPGAIIVFHDSQKAQQNLKEALPLILKELTQKGYIFKSLCDVL